MMIAMPSRLALITKRAFDLCLVVVTAPLWVPIGLLVSVAVKVGSRGPVLFCQTRVGRGGKAFRILKFRTMRPNDGTGAKVTVAGDNRVTPIGALLRASKLDELPQLLNVLKGEMSLIGPRPEVPEYVALYSERDRRIVLSLRPGITDLASIRFRDEAGLLAGQADPLAYYVKVILPRKLRYARFYARRVNVALDCVLLLWTVMAILGREPHRH